MRDSLDCCSNSGHAAFRYGFFSANAPRPALWLVAGLIAHYGTVLDAVAGEQTTPYPVRSDSWCIAGSMCMIIS